MACRTRLASIFEILLGVVVFRDKGSGVEQISFIRIQTKTSTSRDKQDCVFQICVAKTAKQELV